MNDSARRITAIAPAARRLLRLAALAFVLAAASPAIAQPWPIPKWAGPADRHAPPELFGFAACERPGEWELSHGKELRILDTAIRAESFWLRDNATLHATRTHVDAKLGFTCWEGAQALFEQSTFKTEYLEASRGGLVYMHGGSLSGLLFASANGVIDLRNVTLNATYACPTAGGEIIFFNCTGDLRSILGSGRIRIFGGHPRFPWLSPEAGGVVELHDLHLDLIDAMPNGGEVDLRQARADRVEFFPCKPASALRITSPNWLAFRDSRAEWIFAHDADGRWFHVVTRGAWGAVYLDDGHRSEHKLSLSDIRALNPLIEDQLPPHFGRGRQYRFLAAAIIAPLAGCLAGAVVLRGWRRRVDVLKLLSLALCIAFALLWHRTASTEDWWYRVGRGERLTEVYSAGGALRFWSSAHVALAPDPRWNYRTRDRRRTLGLLPTPHFGGNARGAAARATAPIVVPYWLCCALTATLPLLGVGSAGRRILRRRQNRCVACGYSLQTSGARCPECGTIPAGAKA